MKISLHELLPHWVVCVIPFLKWIQEETGISTSGLQLGWTWVLWFRRAIEFASGQADDFYPGLPRAFFWSTANAQNSHNERPWSFWTEDDDFPF